MRIVRRQKGKNDFSLEGLTIGKLMAIKNALMMGPLGPVGQELFEFLEHADLGSISTWGDSHIGQNPNP